MSQLGAPKSYNLTYQRPMKETMKNESGISRIPGKEVSQFIGTVTGTPKATWLNLRTRRYTY